MYGGASAKDNSKAARRAGMMPPMPAIEFREISLRFGGRTLFDRWTARIERGERVVIRGASGAGKTSLLRMALGLQQPDAGSVAVNGEPLDARSVWEVRRKVACVPQHPELGSGTVREAVESVMRLRANRSLAQDGAAWARALEMAGLPAGALGMQTSRLSGGECQRVALAIALLLDRPLLLLDEPTAALDAASKRLVRERLLALPAACTLVVVAHDDEWRGGGAMREIHLGGEAAPQ